MYSDVNKKTNKCILESVWRFRSVCVLSHSVFKVSILCFSVSSHFMPLCSMCMIHSRLTLSYTGCCLFDQRWAGFIINYYGHVFWILNRCVIYAHSIIFLQTCCNLGILCDESVSLTFVPQSKIVSCWSVHKNLVS